MSYVPPLGAGVDFTWKGSPAYVPPLGGAVDLDFRSSGGLVKVIGFVLGLPVLGLGGALGRVARITLAVAGIAKFTDGAVAELARAWRRDTGAWAGDAVPAAESGAYAIEDLARSGYDVTIFRAGYRPLTHGPVQPYVKVLES